MIGVKNWNGDRTKASKPINQMIRLNNWEKEEERERENIIIDVPDLSI